MMEPFQCDAFHCLRTGHVMHRHQQHVEPEAELPEYSEEAVRLGESKLSSYRSRTCRTNVLNVYTGLTWAIMGVPCGLCWTVVTTSEAATAATEASGQWAHKVDLQTRLILENQLMLTAQHDVALPQ